MKPITILTAVVLLFSLVSITSCKKDPSCQNCKEGNKPPIACAGADQFITLPTNVVTLDGSCSSDPDNNIAAYNWTKIAGPSSFNILHATAVQTQVTGLVQGVYLFELKVTDADLLSAKDTVQITVNSTTPACNNNRPELTAQLILVGTLSKPRHGMAVAAAGNKVVFAGGNGTTDCPECWGSSRVDIYDIVTKTWSTAELSKGRWGIAAIASGNKIFFAGGENGDGAFDTYYASVDIYDAATDTWSVAALSEPRSYIAAAAAGNKVIFAGGEKDWNYNTSASVDIYDLSSNTWSTAQLSEARSSATGLTANGKVYFAGGSKEDRWYKNPSSNIDVYDINTNNWSLTNLNEPREFLAGITVANKIYWAGGLIDASYTPSCRVEVKDVTAGTTTIEYLFRPSSWWNNNGANAVLKDNKIIFFRQTNWPQQISSSFEKFDIYDVITNTWSIGVVPQSIEGVSIISDNNIIYIAGGTVNGVLSDKVWKLEF